MMATMMSAWHEPVADGAVLRLGARVLLIDQHDRVLLLRFINDKGEPFWCPVGGGIDPGETPEAAALREVEEETGYQLDTALTEIGRRRHVVSFRSKLVDAREHWYFARVETFAVDTRGCSPTERAMIEEHRWWPGAELHHATDRLVPENLASVVSELLCEGPPSELFDLPV